MIKRRSGVIQPYLLVVILVGIIVVGLGAGYFSYRALQPQLNTNNSTSTTNLSSVNTTHTTANANEVLPNDNVAINVNANTNSQLANSIGQVVWQKPTQLSSLKLIANIKYSGVTEQNANYYRIGAVITGNFAGADVILASIGCDCPSPYPSYYRLLKKGSTYTLLTKNSDDLYQNNGPFVSTVKLEKVRELTDLVYPDSLPMVSPQATLVRDKVVNAFFDAADLVVVFNDRTYGPVYTKIVEFKTGSATMIGTSEIVSRDGFYLGAADGTIVVYKLKPEFVTFNDSFSGQGKPNITWADGSKNSNDYYTTALTGCGASNYLNVVTSVKLTDLAVIGTTSTGDNVYTYQQTTDPDFKEYYNNTYQVFEGSKVSFATFMASHPIIFWVDPFNRLVKFTSAKYAPAVECGKPVIYLYPQTTTNVDVTLQPAGGFTKSEPVYHSGWHVTAQPNGALLNLADRKTYPYLFWEGRGGLYPTPTKGFVVARNNIHEFLVSALAKLGLNQNETSDFLAFWEPRMQGSSYYRISFYGNRMMDQLAPLIVSPPPDTVIRILMDYEPLNQPIHLSPQTLSAPARHGFTVIEWGGVIR